MQPPRRSRAPIRRTIRSEVNRMVRSNPRRLPLPGAERGGDLTFVQNRAVVALDQQRHAAVIVDVLGPTERVIQCGILLEQPAVLLERRHGFRAARAAVNPISHRNLLLRSSCQGARLTPGGWLGSRLVSGACGANG